MTRQQMDDMLALTLTIWGEARGEEVEGQIGVGQVAQHRMLDKKGRWPKNVKSVCLHPKQFSCWNATDKNAVLLDTLLEGLKPDWDYGALTATVGPQILWVAEGILRSHITDRVAGANHYHVQGLHPAWAEGKLPVAQIGQHLFYRL